MSDEPSRPTEDAAPSRARLLWHAARPPTLWAAVSPVLVGSGLAAGDGVFRLDAFVAALVGALAIQVAANYVNDIYDARRGADGADRIGPTRVVAAGLLDEATLWRATAVAIAVAVASGLALTAIAGPVVLAIGVASLLAMYGYVGGPWPYGYRTLGEVFVFAFFGVVATVGSRLVHDGSAPLDAWLLSIPVGLLVSAILVANNVRDIETDARAGKRTLAVLLGRERTARLYAALVWGAFGSIVVFASLGLTPRATALAGFLAPFAAPLVRDVRRRRDGPGLIRVLKGTARLHLLVGLFLAVGAAIG